MRVYPHYSIELVYPTNDDSIKLAKKVNEAIKPFKQRADRYAYSSLKLIPPKSPLVC
jgi:hypothetical protein